MAAGYHFLSEEKTQLKLDAGSDISSALVKQIWIKDPEGTETKNDATIVGTDFLQYEIPVLDKVGQWEAQIYVELTSGWKGNGKTVVWQVYDQYETPD